MSNWEIKYNARKALQGKLGKGALIFFCYIVISYVIALIPVIGTIIYVGISIPMAYGLIATFIKLKRGENVRCTQFLEEAFSNFGKAWGICIQTILKMKFPIILMVIASILFAIGLFGMMALGWGDGTVFTRYFLLTGISIIIYAFASICIIIRGLLYILTDYILFDNPNMTAKEIVETSERLMKGNRIKYFWLQFSFIGLIILSAFTLGIAFLWLIPYMQVATICFYESFLIKETAIEDYNPISEKY